MKKFKVTLERIGTITKTGEKRVHTGVLPSGVDIWVERFRTGHEYDSILVEKEFSL